MLSFPGTGIQLAVSDTDTAPEGLFFELVKPPHHGIVLKYSADVQELMRAGEWSKSFPQSRRGASLAGLADQEETDAPGRYGYIHREALSSCELTEQLGRKGGLVPSLRITRSRCVPGTGKVAAFPLPCQLLNKCPHNSQPWQDGIKCQFST